MRNRKCCLIGFAAVLSCSLSVLSVAAQGIDFPTEEFLVGHPYSTEELLQYASYPSLNWQYETYGVEVEWTVIRELVKRKETNKLLRAFEHPVDKFQEEVVARALREIDADAIYPVFKRRINHDVTKTMYACLNYLAKRGDEEALKILNDNYFKYGSSLEWAETVEWFGRYKYKPAIPNLINSLDAASLNLVGSAQWSLEQIFKGPHPEFKSIGEMKRYFEKLYEKGR